MARPPAPYTANPKRFGLQGAPAQESQTAAQRKGWPFAEGSQNHLDETSAPWPRPSSRPAPAKAPAPHAPDQ